MHHARTRTESHLHLKSFSLPHSPFLIPYPPMSWKNRQSFLIDPRGCLVYRRTLLADPPTSPLDRNLTRGEKIMQKKRSTQPSVLAHHILDMPYSRCPPINGLAWGSVHIATQVDRGCQPSLPRAAPSRHAGRMRPWCGRPPLSPPPQIWKRLLCMSKG